MAMVMDMVTDMVMDKKRKNLGGDSFKVQSSMINQKPETN